MSFPKIPDIKGIKLEDAINLLLTSIALEEESLSKLMDAETKKMLYVLNECKLKNLTIQDTKDLNKSVNQTITNMIKFQMLLQFKLENIKEMLSTTTTTTASTTTTTTTTHTTTCTTSTESTTTGEKGKCGLSGMAIGSVSNKFDNLYCKTAILQANVGANIKQKKLSYLVKNNIEMAAYAESLEIKCLNHLYPGMLEIKGIGLVKRFIKNCKDITTTVSFMLQVFVFEAGKSCFRIQMKSKEKPELDHDSGCIHSINSDMLIG